MKVSLYGYDIELEYSTDNVGLLNINNRVLMKSIIDYFLYNMENEECNDVVIMNNDIRLNDKSILYVQDLYLFKFDSKAIIAKVFQRFKKGVFSDDSNRDRYDKLYLSLLSDILVEFDLLGIEYDFKNEFDPTFFTKVPSFDFATNDSLDLKDKICAIINIAMNVFDYKIIVLYKVYYLLNEEDVKEVCNHAKLKGIYILFIDSLVVDEVVSIKQLFIDNFCSQFLINGKI